MKNYFNFLLIAMTLVITSSCVDEAKDPLPTPPYGAFAFIDIENALIDASDATSAFKGTINDPGGNLASYELSVSVDGTNFAPFQTYTSFPISLNVTLADVAAALGISASDIQPGDQVVFSAVVTSQSGDVATIDNLNGDANNPGERQAFAYSGFVFCPFVQADAVGTYTITRDGFGTTVGDDIFEVIAGPGENQITMVNPFDHPNPDDGGAQSYNVVITVDAATGAASVAKQAAWHCTNFGCPYGEGRVNTTGSTNFVFSCVGLITGTFSHTVDLGSFGDYAFEARKN